MDPIYLDNNATTPLLPAAWEAMQPYFFARPGNPASSHHAGRLARKALEDAREQIAGLLDAQPDEVLFTSGATEANNLALFGLAGDPPGSLASSPLEHPSVTEPIAQLTARGFTQAPLAVGRVANLPGNGRLATCPTGTVDVPAIFPANTRLVTVQLANHETGAIQPVETLARRLDPDIPLHCDAAAAAGKIPVYFRQLGVTTLTVSAHKFHGPKGIGALIVKKYTKLRPQLFGGHQQQGQRPGTEPVPLAVGMAAALDWAVRHLDSNRQKIQKLREIFLTHLGDHAAPVVLNSPEERGIPHTLNLSFPGCRADVLLMNLDLAGVACSTGSACSSGSLLPSPILVAMQVPPEILHSAMRFSFSSMLTEAEVLEAARRITLIVNRLRRENPKP